MANQVVFEFLVFLNDKTDVFFFHFYFCDWADQDAMSTTLLAEWNALNAVLQGTRTRNEFIIQAWRGATLIIGDAARFLY